MPLLKPDKLRAAQNLLEEILPSAQSTKDIQKISVSDIIGPKKSNNGNAREVYNKAGLTLEHVAKRQKEIVDFGEENNRVRVLESVSKIHGALNEEAEKQAPVINITFNNINGDISNLEGVLIPR